MQDDQQPTIDPRPPQQPTTPDPVSAPPSTQSAQTQANNIPSQTTPHPTTQTPSDQSPIQPITQPAKKSPIKKIIFISLGIAAFLTVLIVLFFVYIFGAVNNATAAPLSASDSFIKTIESGNSATAYTKTSGAFQAVESQAKLADFISKYNSEINSNYTVVISKKVSNSNGVQTATIIYNVQNKSTAKNQYLRVVLEKEGNDWKVKNIEYQANPFEGQ